MARDCATATEIFVRSKKLKFKAVIPVTKHQNNLIILGYGIQGFDKTPHVKMLRF